jgi:uridine phosphorylase
VATDSNIWLEPQPPLEEKERLFYKGEKKVIEMSFRAIEILSEKGI